MLGWPAAGVIGGVCAYLFLITAVFFALRTICMEVRRHIQNPKKLGTVLSIVLPVLVLVGAVVYLVCYLVYHTPLMLEEDTFYRQALVSNNHTIAFEVHGASWLYTWLLHGLLLIFGNTPFAGVVLQIALYFICLLLLYIGMQAFVGAVPAAVSMAAFGFLPISLSYVFSLTPELFHLALYLLGFCLTAAFCRKFRLYGTFSPVQYLLIFLTGLIIGFLCYLDIYGVSLYLFLAILYSVDQEKMKQAAGANLLAILGGSCGFLLSVILVCQIEKISVFAYLQELFALYFQEAGFRFEFSQYAHFLPDVTLVGSVVLISASFFIIPAFFLWKRCQNSAFIMNLFLLYGLAVFSVSYLNTQMIVTFAWSIMAGLGVYGVIRQSEGADTKEVDDGVKEEQPEERKPSEKVDKEEQKDKMSGKVDGKVRIEEIELSEEKEKMSEKSAVEKEEQEKPAPGKPLHNPLPVPKKKKRSSMDFGHQVKETDMKFDIDVSEEDDFDW